MKSKLRLILFALLATLQLAVPGSMIATHEATLRYGVQYRFHTAPIDPYHPFRGRYVWLNLEPDAAPAPEGQRLSRGQAFYAILETDAEGFAQVKETSLRRPAGNNYIRVRAGHNAGNGTVYIEWPFDHYYMDEKLAPEAERAVRENSRGERPEASVTVRVRRGHAVLEELFIRGTPVVEYLRAERAADEDGLQPSGDS